MNNEKEANNKPTTNQQLKASATLLVFKDEPDDKEKNEFPTATFPTYLADDRCIQNDNKN